MCVKGIVHSRLTSLIHYSLPSWCGLWSCSITHITTLLSFKETKNHTQRMPSVAMDTHRKKGKNKHNTSPYSGYLAKNMVLTLGRHHTGSMKTCYLFLLLFFFYVGDTGPRICPLGEILPICETPELSRGLERGCMTASGNILGELSLLNVPKCSCACLLLLDPPFSQRWGAACMLWRWSTMPCITSQDLDM